METFLASAGLVFIRLIELHGIDSARFMEELGIDPLLLSEPKARIPARFSDMAFTKAALLIQKPEFALRAAECWHPSNLGALGYAWLSSGTLRTGLKRFERFSQVLGKMSYRCEDAQDGLHFVYEHGRGNAAVAYIIADFAMSIIMSLCRRNYGNSLTPLTVRLRCPPPRNPFPYENFYRCPVIFGSGENSIVLQHDIADAPLSTGNQEIAATFDAILNDQLVKLTEADIPTRCKSYLLQQLTSGAPSEEDLAVAMGMSRRTLQRKLGDAGLTYSDLLDQTRFDLALRYLDDQERSVTEVTFLLGFSEQSAFSRAFKRWSGKSPSTYRSEIALAA
ncbi:MAG TPA: AraC family transcriptional regulator [Methylophilaceae bacterium]|nr:AraC family transcriptional regulator [Methylophilaceae bacterium]